MSRGDARTVRSVTSGQLKRGASNVGRRTRGVLGGGLGLATLLTVLIFATPIASAAGITTFTAPYTGWSSYNSNYVSSSGCAAAHQNVAPSWNAATGFFTYAARASANSCSSSTYNYASVYGVTTITSAAFSGTHGHSSYIYLNWNMSVAARAAVSFTPGANYSYSYASVSGTAYSYLIDVTNGSSSYITSAYTTLFGMTITGTGLYALQTGWVSSYQYLTATLLMGHTYELTISIYVSGFVSIYGGTGSGVASIGLAGSHGLGLASVTVY